MLTNASNVKNSVLKSLQVPYYTMSAFAGDLRKKNINTVLGDQNIHLFH